MRSTVCPDWGFLGKLVIKANYWDNWALSSSNEEWGFHWDKINSILIYLWFIFIKAVFCIFTELNAFSYSYYSCGLSSQDLLSWDTQLSLWIKRQARELVLLKVTLSVSDRNCRSPNCETTALPIYYPGPLGLSLGWHWLPGIGALVDAESLPQCMTTT